MHVSTETSHHAHIVEIDGVGVTETDLELVEAICQIDDGEAETGDIAAMAHSRDRQQAWRGLKRLRKAGVVDSREVDVDLAGTARKPIVWWVTERAKESGVVDRLRSSVDTPLDPVQEREERIEELEETVSELRKEVTRLRDEVDSLKHEVRSVDENEPSEDEDPWVGVDLK